MHLSFFLSAKEISGHCFSATNVYHSHILNADPYCALTYCQSLVYLLSYHVVISGAVLSIRFSIIHRHPLNQRFAKGIRNDIKVGHGVHDPFIYPGNGHCLET